MGMDVGRGMGMNMGISQDLLREAGSQPEKTAAAKARRSDEGSQDLLRCLAVREDSWS